MFQRRQYHRISTTFTALDMNKQKGIHLESFSANSLICSWAIRPASKMQYLANSNPITALDRHVRTKGWSQSRSIWKYSFYKSRKRYNDTTNRGSKNFYTDNGYKVHALVPIRVAFVGVETLRGKSKLVVVRMMLNSSGYPSRGLQPN